MYRTDNYQAIHSSPKNEKRLRINKSGRNWVTEFQDQFQNFQFKHKEEGPLRHIGMRINI